MIKEQEQGRRREGWKRGQGNIEGEGRREDRRGVKMGRGRKKEQSMIEGEERKVEREELDREGGTGLDWPVFALKTLILILILIPKD